MTLYFPPIPFPIVFLHICTGQMDAPILMIGCSKRVFIRGSALWGSEKCIRGQGVKTPQNRQKVGVVMNSSAKSQKVTKNLSSANKEIYT
jgi:hypothetical protein